MWERYKSLPVDVYVFVQFVVRHMVTQFYPFFNSAMREMQYTLP